MTKSNNFYNQIETAIVSAMENESWFSTTHPEASDGRPLFYCNERWSDTIVLRLDKEFYLFIAQSDNILIPELYKVVLNEGESLERMFDNLTFTVVNIGMKTPYHSAWADVFSLGSNTKPSIEEMAAIAATMTRLAAHQNCQNIDSLPFYQAFYKTTKVKDA